MITLASAVLALSAATIAPPPFVANSDKAEAGRLHIGDTGIRCVRLPCPARAVFEPEADGGPAQRDRMYYVDLEGNAPPPPMIGNEVDLRAVKHAWEESQCLAITGRWIPGEEDRPVLRVDGILGACNQQ